MLPYLVNECNFFFPQGIYVTRVTEGGPAEVAGLQIGDKIMQVNSKIKTNNDVLLGAHYRAVSAGGNTVFWVLPRTVCGAYKQTELWHKRIYYIVLIEHL